MIEITTLLSKSLPPPEMRKGGSRYSRLSAQRGFPPLRNRRGFSCQGDRTRQPVQVASRTGNMEAIPDSLLVGDVFRSHLDASDL
jgi:hypothetical protein